MRIAVIACTLLAIDGCGRLSFDPYGTADDATSRDVPTGDATVPSSCAGLAPTCGPSGTHGCCDSPVVDGGIFYRSYDGVGFDTMTNPATVSGFRLDAYEITVGRFRAFVIAGKGTQLAPPSPGTGAHATDPASGWSSSWSSSLATNTAALTAAVKCDATLQTWTDSSGGNESLPVNCITWYEAQAFCAWDGGYLPSEAEWNYAASGGTAQRAYPWSTPPGSTSIDETLASYQCLGDAVAGCALTDVAPAGSKPQGNGLWGQSDLAGNVFEWTLDYWSTTYANPCVDCINLTVDTSRVVRGGSFDRVPSDLRAALRNYAPSNDRNHDRGARCARPL